MPPVEHQVQPGRSGNPGGRPKTPMTEWLRAVGRWPVPADIRAQLEKAYGMALPESLTFAQAAALTVTRPECVDW